MLHQTFSKVFWHNNHFVQRKKRNDEKKVGASIVISLVRKTFSVTSGIFFRNQQNIFP